MHFYTASKPWGDILPRYAFLEPILADKRILEIGCGDGSGTIFLKERGASEVIGIDVDGPDFQEALRRQSPSRVSFRAINDSRIEAPSADFDIAIAFGLPEQNDENLFAEIQRVLKPGGYFITANKNPEHPSFSKLYSLKQPEPSMTFEEQVAFLQQHFTRVTVFGQTPFLGFYVGWMGAEDEELPLEMDDVLVADGGEDAAYYVMVCGRDTVAFESQSLIQLPYRRVMNESIKQIPRRSAQDEQLTHLEQKLIESEQEITDLRDQLGKVVGDSKTSQDNETRLQDALNEREQELRGLRVQFGKEAEENRALQESQIDLQEKVKLQEQKIMSLQEQLDKSAETDHETSENKEAILRLENELLDKEKHLDKLRIENDELNRSLETMEERLLATEGQLQQKNDVFIELQRQVENTQDEVAEKVSWLDAARSEVDRLQQQLRDSKLESSTLQKQLKDMAGKVEDARKDSENAARLSKVKEENKGLQLAIKKLGDELVVLREERESYSAERQKLLDVEKQRQGLLDQTSEQLRALQDKYDHIVVEYEEVREKMAAHKAKLQESEAENATMAEELKKIKESNDWWKKTSKEIQDRESTANAEKESLRLSLSSCQEKTAVMRQRLEEQSSKFDEISSKFTEQRERNSELESDLVDMVNRFQNEQAQELNRKRLDRELQERHLLQQQELGEAQEKISDLTKEVYLVRRQEEELAETLAQVRKNATLWRREVEWNKAKQAESEERTDRARMSSKRVSELEQEFAWQSEELDRLRIELQSRQDEVERLHEEVEQTQVGWSQDLNKWERGEKELQQMRADFGELKKIYEEKSEKMNKLEQWLDLERSKGERLTSDIAQVRQELEEQKVKSQQELQTVVDEEQTLQARVATLQKQLGELQEKTAGELSSVHEQVRRREEQMQSLTNKLADMEEDLSSARQESEKLISQIEDKEREIVEIQEKCFQLEERASKVAENQMAGSDYAAEKAKWEAELSASRRRLVELEEMVEQIRKQSSEKEQSLGNKLEDAQKSAADLRQKLEESMKLGDADRLTPPRTEHSVEDVEALKSAVLERDRRIKILEVQLSDRSQRIQKLVRQLTELRK
jgi:chromosome segregation ATPase